MSVHTSLLFAVAVVAPAAQVMPTPQAPPAPVAPRSVRAPSAPAPPVPPVAVVAAPGHAPHWTVQYGEVAPRGPHLGVEISAMSESLRKFFGAPADAGLLVQGVASGSAAEDAKVAVGDVIVEIGGTAIADVADVHRALADRSAQEVKLVVIRKKRRKQLEATLPMAEPHDHRAPMVSPFRVRLPPEAARGLSPQMREHVEQELAAAQAQLREVERRLGQIERHAHHEADGHTSRERHGRADDAGARAKRRRRSRSRP